MILSKTYPLLIFTRIDGTFSFHLQPPEQNSASSLTCSLLYILQVTDLLEVKKSIILVSKNMGYCVGLEKINYTLLLRVIIIIQWCWEFCMKNWVIWSVYSGCHCEFNFYIVYTQQELRVREKRRKWKGRLNKMKKKKDTLQHNQTVKVASRTISALG